MSEPARQRMTSDEFIAWAMEQPETCHYELVDGEVVAMDPEQVAHTRTKALIWRRLGSVRLRNSAGSSAYCQLESGAPSKESDPSALLASQATENMSEIHPDWVLKFTLLLRSHVEGINISSTGMFTGSLPLPNDGSTTGAMIWTCFMRR